MASLSIAISIQKFVLHCRVQSYFDAIMYSTFRSTSLIGMSLAFQQFSFENFQSCNICSETTLPLIPPQIRILRQKRRKLIEQEQEMEEKEIYEEECLVLSMASIHYHFLLLPETNRQASLACEDLRFCCYHDTVS